jgi:hypothetical protein
MRRSRRHESLSWEFSRAVLLLVGNAIFPSGTFVVESLDCRDKGCYARIHSDIRWPMDESTSLPLCDLVEF